MKKILNERKSKLKVQNKLETNKITISKSVGFTLFSHYESLKPYVSLMLYWKHLFYKYFLLVLTTTSKTSIKIAAQLNLELINFQ